MNSSSTLVGDESAVLSTGVWYHIQFRRRKNETSNDGVIAFKVNDVLVDSEITNVSSSSNDIRIGVGITGSGSPQFYYSDVYVDGTSWPGMLKFKADMPDSDEISGATMTVEPGGSAMWETLDEVPADDDTSYTRISTLNETSAYHFPDIPANWKPRGVAYYVYGKHEGTATNGRMGFVVDGALFLVTNFVLSASYSHFSEIPSVWPEGETTRDAINSFPRFLFTSASNGTRFSQAYRYVAYLVDDSAVVLPPSHGGKPSVGKGKGQKPKNRPIVGNMSGMHTARIGPE
jgi:hypothetical protein